MLEIHLLREAQHYQAQLAKQLERGLHLKHMYLRASC